MRPPKANSAIKEPGTKPNGYYYSKDAMRQNIPLAQPVTPEVEQKARLTVCANATDVDDAVQLLKMLGLIK